LTKKKRKRNNNRGLSVEVRDDNVNVALRKFKKKVEDSGKLIDVVKRQHFEKPTTEKKRKKGAARARWLKKLRDESLPKKMY
jgi:small subunit ribosomal protein S21